MAIRLMSKIAALMAHPDILIGEDDKMPTGSRYVYVYPVGPSQRTYGFVDFVQMVEHAYKQIQPVATETPQKSLGERSDEAVQAVGSEMDAFFKRLAGLVAPLSSPPSFGVADFIIQLKADAKRKLAELLNKWKSNAMTATDVEEFSTYIKTSKECGCPDCKEFLTEVDKVANGRTAGPATDGGARNTNGEKGVGEQTPMSVG
jgi:hypothetical protein